jgi:hypothetical protein
MVLVTPQRHLHLSPPELRRGLLALLLSAATVATLGCAPDGAEPQTAVQPLQPSGTSDRDGTGAAGAWTTPPEHAAGPGPTTGPTDRATTDTRDQDSRSRGSSDQMAIVTDVLARYSAALDGLVADPASIEPTSPALAAWQAVVVPGGPLDRDVLSGVRRRLQEEQVVIGPGPEGYAYRHRPVEVLESSADRVRFRWCVHAPGVARTIADGAVVDDEVGHATGTGRAVRDTSGRWVLDALEQEELRVLPTGRPDPCP